MPIRTSCISNNSMSTATFQIAKQRFEQYSADFNEQLMEDHAAAMDCWDCEAHIQMGIDAIRWLELAERVFNQICMENSSVRPTVDGLSFGEWLSSQYRSFLARSEQAQSWIANCERQGYTVSNKQQFASTVELAEDWLEQSDWQSRTVSIFDED